MIEGSDFALPSSAKNSSRFGNCALSSELYMTDGAVAGDLPHHAEQLAEAAERAGSVTRRARRACASFASNCAESALLARLGRVARALPPRPGAAPACRAARGTPCSRAAFALRLDGARRASAGAARSRLSAPRAGQTARSGAAAASGQQRATETASRRFASARGTGTDQHLRARAVLRDRRCRP